jgi:hypothetical protein
MQALSNREILSRPDSGLSTEMVVRKWLVALGSLCGREITPLLISTWCEVLSTLTPGQADQGFRELVKSWTFAHFPTPGAVLSQFKNAEEKGFTLEAERAWEKLLAWVEQNYYPDIGVRTRAPRLCAAIEHAARAAGGYAHIERCSLDQLVWVRKEFISAYRNVHETGQVEHLIGNAEAKRILSGFRKVRALPMPKRQHRSWITSACDRCGNLLGAVRWDRRGEPGEWCSEVCRDGNAAVHSRQARRAGRPRLKLSATGRISHRRKQIREAAQRHRLSVIKNGQQPTDAKPVTDAILSSGYTPSTTAISPVLEALR